MSKINWARFVIGGLVAAIILFVADGVLHEHVFHGDWEAVYAGLKAGEPGMPHGSAMVYFAVFELGRGLITVLIYVLMRPFFGAGPKTAVIAGIIGWLAFSIAGPAQFIPLGFYSTALWVKVGVAHLVTSVVATIAGAAIYKDVGPTAAAVED